MGVIFFASTLPGSDIPGGFSVEGHFFEYAVLGMLLFLAGRRTLAWRRAALLAIAVASAYGVTDEVHQIFTPGRTPDPADWATDTVGAAVGVAIVLVWLRYRFPRRPAEDV
jgi:VanZ family protein